MEAVEVISDGGCHGTDPIKVFSELCDIIEETVAIYEERHKPLPSPLSSRDLVNRLHQVA